MHIERLLAERGGVARRRDLAGALRSGRSRLDRELAAMVEAGALLRPRRGLYALPDADEAATAAVSVGGIVGCVSAARTWDLPLLEPPTTPHVAVPRSASSRIRTLVPQNTVIHWDSALERDPGDVRVRSAIALSQVVRCLPVPEAVAVLDAGVGRGVVSLEDLWRVGPRHDRAGYDQVLRLVDPRAQSVAESIGRVALVLAGLEVRTQVGLSGVGAVDLLVEGLVVVECDGFAYHSGRAEFRNDRRRDRVIALDHGLLELRFAYEEVVHDLPGFVATVRRGVAVARAREASRATRP